MAITTDVSAYFNREARETRRLVKKILRKPTEDRIHELRVSLRRERTILKTLEHEGAHILSQREKKILKRIWRDLGENRDLDVAKTLADQFHLKGNKLRKARKKAEKKLLKDLKRKSSKQLFKGLEKLSEEAALRNFCPVKSIGKLQQKIKETGKSSDDLHQYRIILKEVRYLLESLNLNIDRFKKFQDILGTLNDLRHFISIAGTHPELENAHKKKLTEAKRIVAPARKLALDSLNKAKGNLS